MGFRNLCFRNGFPSSSMIYLFRQGGLILGLWVLGTGPLHSALVPGAQAGCGHWTLCFLPKFFFGCPNACSWLLSYSTEGQSEVAEWHGWQVLVLWGPTLDKIQLTLTYSDQLFIGSFLYPWQDEMGEQKEKPSGPSCSIPAKASSEKPLITPSSRNIW